MQCPVCVYQCHLSGIIHIMWWVGPPKKRHFKRLKITGPGANISDDNIGNEIEVGAARPDKSASVGSYKDMEFLRSLEEKILQQKKENLALSRRLKNKTAQLKRLQRKSKTHKLDDGQVLAYLSNVKKYSSAQIQFTEMQLRNSSRNPHGRRYKPKEKSMCLAMYKSGPRSYRFKENNKIMVLPSLSTLTRHSAKMIFRTGIVPQLFSFIKEKVKDWTEKELLCSFGFDETALKSILEYSSTDDEIIGFVEMGGIRRPIFATHSLTFMVRGIYRPFKQPVAYFYTHGLKSHELAELILLVLEAVFSTGLNVIHSVSDQVVTNESAIHRLMDRHFVRSPGCLLKYKVCDKTIIHGYDAPHWLKVVRNNLQVKNFKHFISERWNISTPKIYGKSQVASWDDVESVYDQDKTGCPRLLPNINGEHIKPERLKMKVCVATQVFSQKYSNVMEDFADRKLIRDSSRETARMLLFFNDLFDSVNGSGPAQIARLKGSINERSVHFVFWDWALFMLSKMDFIDKVSGEVNHHSTVINKIQSTIRGYQEVTRICLNSNIEEVSLRYFKFSVLNIF
ncbi:uncharacterized protein LOC119075785 isoform X2 [Bradysia coprophila]|uniref:uncharacterized protein LOC119075785 isoform X2 n=1 Tax=Bradysia coprophila TaxID=38358 RepID=UPI00187DC1C8|nr:uncharacterized protein LOC119075785 isoform X2 [Bradysia coprophila]